MVVVRDVLGAAVNRLIAPATGLTAISMAAEHRGKINCSDVFAAGQGKMRRESNREIRKEPAPVRGMNSRKSTEENSGEAEFGAAENRHYGAACAW